jgi:peptide/nickel transport system substrate-binding protein
MDLSRRDLLAAGGLTLAGTALTPRRARAQTPKRGGTLALRLWDPPHFDLHGPGGLSYKLHIALTFTHSRLVKPKAGPNIQPGTVPLEGDLAESWTQPTDTTYVFKLRRGVKWHPKPPVNGRELTADDVVYSVNRFLTTKGNANAFMLGSLDKVEAVDKYTVKFTLKEPFAWFLDTLANPMAVAIVAKECVDKFGDLKKWESVVGTGPWMLDAYRPNQGMTLVRNPGYFVPGLPHIDRVEVSVDEDNASRISSFLAGKYDIGWENPGIINRTDWVQIKDKVKRPVRTAEFPANVMSHISMRRSRSTTCASVRPCRWRSTARGSSTRWPRAWA